MAAVKAIEQCKCKTCRYYMAGPGPEFRGQCRRNPPPWEWVSDVDWCGEWASGKRPAPKREKRG